MRLRPARPEDRAWALALAQLPEVAASVMVGADAALDEALARIAAGATDEAALVIEADDRRVGLVRWRTTNRRSRIAVVTGLMVDPAARGRGIATAALRALAGTLFIDHGFHRVEAEVYGFNDAALRAFDRAGFARDGRRRKAYDRHGAWQDGVLYGRLADDPDPLVS